MMIAYGTDTMTISDFKKELEARVEQVIAYIDDGTIHVDGGYQIYKLGSWLKKCQLCPKSECCELCGGLGHSEAAGPSLTWGVPSRVKCAALLEKYVHSPSDSK